MVQLEVRIFPRLWRNLDCRNSHGDGAGDRRTTSRNGELQQTELQYNVSAITHDLHKLQVWCKLFENDQAMVKSSLEKLTVGIYSILSTSIDVRALHYVAVYPSPATLLFWQKELSGAHEVGAKYSFLASLYFVSNFQVYTWNVRCWPELMPHALFHFVMVYKCNILSWWLCECSGYSASQIQWQQSSRNISASDIAVLSNLDWSSMSLSSMVTMIASPHVASVPAERIRRYLKCPGQAQFHGYQVLNTKASCWDSALTKEVHFFSKPLETSTLKNRVITLMQHLWKGQWNSLAWHIHNSTHNEEGKKWNHSSEKIVESKWRATTFYICLYNLKWLWHASDKLPPLNCREEDHTGQLLDTYFT